MRTMKHFSRHPVAYNKASLKLFGLFGYVFILGIAWLALGWWTTPKNVQAATCSSFTASSYTITSGQSTTLSWSSSGGSNWGVSPNIGTIGANGSKSVTPTSTTKYTLVVNYGIPGYCSKELTVKVNPAPVTPVTCNSFTISPSTISSGQSTTFSWSSSGGSSWGIDPSIGNIGASGSQTVNPTATTTYTFIVNYGQAGQCMISKTVTVNGGNTGATCTAPDRTPEFGVAVVAAGTSSSSLTVTQGTTSVGREYWWAGTVCRTNAPRVANSYMYISGATIRSPNGQVTSIPDISDSLLNLGFSWTNGFSTFTRDQFNASPTGGFTQSGTYTVTVTGYPLNYFPTENKYICVVDVTREVGGTWAIQQCSPDVQSYTINVTVSTPPPSIPECSLTRSPSVVNKGQPVTLTWTTTGATSVTLTDNGNVSLNGSRTVYPSSSTTYSLVATGPGGSKTCTANVGVNVPQNPTDPQPTCNIYANPSTINKGQSVQISWGSLSANQAWLNGSAVSINNPAGTSYSPEMNTSYILVVRGPGGDNSCFVNVIVSGSPDPISTTCTFLNPDPAVIDRGGSSLLNWSSTAATSATLDDGSGPALVNAASSDYSVSPSATTVYVLTVYGPAGSDQCQKTVTVNEPPLAFACESRWYQITDGILRTINFETGDKINIGNTNMPRINAIGYNIQDSMIYGVERDGNDGYLARIDVAGSSTRISGKILSFTQYLFAGDMDSSGNLWFIPDGRVASITKINVTTKIATTYELAATVDASDIVFKDGFLYGIETGSSRKLLIINTTGPSGVPLPVEAKTIATGLPGASQEYTSGWTTSDGKLYFYNRSSGKLYKIINTQTAAPLAEETTVPRDLTSYATTDGASCPNARDPLTKVNFPFVSVNGSDVIAGAKFSSGDICSDPNTADPFGTIKTNGFKVHGYSTTDQADILSGSSSAEYAAFAFSKIYSSGSTSSFLTNNGYYRNIGSSNFARDLTFANATANQPPMDYGRFNSTNSLPCLNISQIEKQATSASSTEVISALKTGSDTQILKMTGSLNIDGPPITIPNNRRLTIIVEELVTINTNIIYADTSSSDGVISSPQLTIIAKNGITIKDSVTRLDGYYDAHNSVFKTCDISASPSTAVCNKQLIVNGGLVGKKIEWRRNYGTLGSDSTTLALPDNSRCSVGSTANGNISNVISAQKACAAEKVKFNPSFYFNNPFGIKPRSSAISGAPLNSIELPPIY